MLVAFGSGLVTGRSLAPAQEKVAVADVAPEKKAPSRPAAAPEPKPQAAPAAATPAPASKPAEGGGGAKQPFNAKLARTAVDRAAVRAKTCRDGRDPAGSVSATVTFAPSGSVSEVTVTTPRYATTKTGRCVVARLSEAKVPAFSGSSVTVKKSLLVK